MTVEIGWNAIPWAVTVIGLALMFRPHESRGGSYFPDLTVILRLFWAIPVLVVWVIYLAVT